MPAPRGVFLRANVEPSFKYATGIASLTTTFVGVNLLEPVSHDKHPPVKERRPWKHANISPVIDHEGIVGFIVEFRLRPFENLSDGLIGSF